MMPLGCSSLRLADAANPPAWGQIQDGMTRAQVHAALGEPLHETEREAEWKGPEVKVGWVSPATRWRMLEVYFDEKGKVNGMRDYEQEK